MHGSAGSSDISPRARQLAWHAYHDPAVRRAAVNGARRPVLPLPDQTEALEQAILLYRIGLSARAVSLVMGHYHGCWASEPTWRRRIQRATRS